MTDAKTRKTATERAAERLAAQQAKLDAKRADLATRAKAREAEDATRNEALSLIDRMRAEARGRRYKAAFDVWPHVSKLLAQAEALAVNDEANLAATPKAAQ